MLNSLLVSWRNITRHKKRFFFTLIAVVLGVAVMTSMLIAKSTFSKLMDEQDRLSAGNADFWIQSNERFFSENELEWIMENEEVEEGVTSLLKHGYVDMETDNLAQASVRFTGISNFQNELIELPVKEGDISKEGLILSENAASLWEKEVGDKVAFTDFGEIEVTAIVHEGAMLNSPKTEEDALLRDFRVMVPLDTLQEWTDMKGQISNYRFNIENDTNQDQLLSSYQSELAGSNLFVQPIVVDTQKNNDIDGMYFVFDLIAILSIFISAFITFNMIHTSIIERKREIAIMKSLAYTSSKVIMQILKEIAFLAVIGNIVGLIIGVWLGYVVQDILISAIVSYQVAYEVNMISPLILSLMFGLSFPFIAAVIPLYKASKTPILSGMLDHTPALDKKKALAHILIILGVVCTGIGFIDNMWAFLFLFVGLVLLFPLWMRFVQFLLRPLLESTFGFVGKQAVRSTKQFENRNANTAAMLAIGVSLALFMSSALESMPASLEKEVRSTFGGDLIVEKETPWGESELETVQNLQGVTHVKSYAELENITWYTKSDELREFSIMSFEDMDLARMFQLVDEVDENSDYPSIYVGERALEEWGGELGEVFTLHSPAGEREFFVKGIVKSSHYSSYVAFVEDEVRKEFLNWPLNYHLAIDVLDEEMVPIVSSNLWQHLGDPIVNMDIMDVNVEQAKSGLTGMNELMQGLLLLIIAISAVGISNTLFMNTLERTKEFGTMRALGFTKRQVKLMILLEGLFIGLTGVIVGTVYGILVIYLNTISKDAPAFLQFSLPWISLLLAVVGGIIFTLLASWLPSTTASRISIKEAINYE
ncbi:ABC transporter permease [Oceanobacillus manasiensis]|uniref:ABC transporter permease n=1 Tax=Oceanobacillus manasiensis TaxID=586413 RepID=UPI0005AB29EF|nr:FtsX-like permease family protein [Oceanobacillus manasiensis]